MTQNKKRLIAVTGGIGSGKSAVLSLLIQKGYVCFSCDRINHEMMSDADYLKRLAELFPDCVSDDTVNRRKLAEIIFSDSRQRERLNTLSHPEIMRRLFEKINAADTDLIFIEVPLLKNTAFESCFNEIVAVDCSYRVRVERICERDGVSPEAAKQKIASQPKCDFPNATVYSLDNSATLAELSDRVEKLLQNLVR